MIVSRGLSEDSYLFNAYQIDECINNLKLKVRVVNKMSGYLPLRYAIRSGRLDVIKLLLSRGASPLDCDKDGVLIKEVLESSNPGNLQLLIELLSWCSEDFNVHDLLEQNHITLGRFSMNYFLRRCDTHSFPANKMNQIGLSRLSALKYRVVGQNYAIESILSDFSGYYINSELSPKPLVLLFAGPPGTSSVLAQY